MEKNGELNHSLTHPAYLMPRELKYLCFGTVYELETQSVILRTVHYFFFLSFILFHFPSKSMNASLAWKQVWLNWNFNTRSDDLYYFAGVLGYQHFLQQPTTVNTDDDDEIAYVNVHWKTRSLV